MRAILVSEPGGPEKLAVGEIADPQPGPGEVVVRNFAAGINRADVLQRRGHYPPPPGASEILGLEFAGEVLEPGEGVGEWSVGDRVFGLVPGGGYAERVCLRAELLVPIPDTFSYESAAAVPEAFMTANEALFTLGGLRAGETVWIDAGASGVGSAAIQLARRAGAKVLTAVGNESKREFCESLGADRILLRGEDDLVEAVREETGGAGADLVIDFVGAAAWSAHQSALATGGRHVVLGLLGGREARVDLARVIFKRLTIRGHAMRGLPHEEKAALTQRFREQVLPALSSGELRATLDRVFLLEEAAAAHERMEANRNAGKMVLRL